MATFSQLYPRVPAPGAAKAPTPAAAAAVTAAHEALPFAEVVGGPRPSRKARARANQRASGAKQRPGPDGGRPVQLWPVRLAPHPRNPVDDFLVAAAFKPTVGWSLPTGRAPIVSRRIDAVGEAVEKPPRWSGRRVLLTSPNGAATLGPVAVKSAAGEGRNAAIVAAAPSNRQSKLAGRTSSVAAAARAPGPSTTAVHRGFVWEAEFLPDGRPFGSGTPETLILRGKVPADPSDAVYEDPEAAGYHRLIRPVGNPAAYGPGDRWYGPVQWDRLPTTTAWFRAAYTHAVPLRAGGGKPVRGNAAHAPDARTDVLATRAAPVAQDKAVGRPAAGKAATPADKQRPRPNPAIGRLGVISTALHPGLDDILDAAYPGVAIGHGAIVASTYALLANVAAEVLKRSTRVDAVYRACPSWAAGCHYMLGDRVSRLEPSWVLSPTPGDFATLADVCGAGERPTGWCAHTPDTCTCVPEPAKRTLLFGGSAAHPVTAQEVAAWCRRFARVYTIVPAPGFAMYETRVQGGQRLFKIPGDPQAVQVPSALWYGDVAQAVVRTGFFGRQQLRWTSKPLGAAFLAVEFETVGLAAAGSEALATLGLSTLLDLGRPTAAGWAVGAVNEDGETDVRRRVVDVAALAASGRALDATTYQSMERAAARHVRENPGDADPASEAIAAARLAWVRIRRLHLAWAPWTWLQELLLPVPAGPGADNTLGRVRRILGALLVYYAGQRLWAARAARLVGQAASAGAAGLGWLARRAAAGALACWLSPAAALPAQATTATNGTAAPSARPSSPVDATPSPAFVTAGLSLGIAFGFVGVIWAGVTVWMLTPEEWRRPTARAAPLVSAAVDPPRRGLFQGVWRKGRDELATGPALSGMAMLGSGLALVVAPGQEDRLDRLGRASVEVAGGFLYSLASTLVPVYAVVCAPVWEEALKRFGVAWMIGFVLLELIEKATVYGVAGAPAYVPVAILHLLWAQLPFRLGVLAHALHNFTQARGAVFGWHQPRGWEALADVLAGRVWADRAVWLGVWPAMVGAGLQPPAPPPPTVSLASLGSTAWAAALARVHASGAGWLPGVCVQEIRDDLVPVDTVALTITQQPPLDACRERPMAALLGPTVASAGPLVYRSCVHNEGAALRLRMGQEPLWADEQVTATWDLTRRRLRGDLRHLIVEPWLREVFPRLEPVPFERWNAQYNMATRVLNLEGKHEYERGGGRRGRGPTVKMFIKIECTPITVVKIETKGPKPRGIQGRTHDITATCGPTMAAAGKALARALPLGSLGPAGGPDPMEHAIAYVGGATAEQLGDWYAAGLAQGLEGDPWDVEMWDTSVGPDAHACWADRVREGHPSRAVVELLAERQHPPPHDRVCRSRFDWRYRLFAEVCSGDADTTAGNSMIHASVWAVGLGSQPHAAVALAGDNCLCMRARGRRGWWRRRMADVYRRHGFRANLEAEDEGWHAGQICSGRLWACSHGFAYGPKIGRVLAKTFWAINPPGTRKWRAHLRSVALGLHATCSYIPILRVIVGAIVRQTSNVPADRLPADREPWRLLAERAHDATPETVTQFCQLYACAPDDLFACEAWLATLQLDRPQVLRHWLLDRVVAVDLDEAD